VIKQQNEPPLTRRGDRLIGSYLPESRGACTKNSKGLLALTIGRGKINSEITSATYTHRKELSGNFGEQRKKR